MSFRIAGTANRKEKVSTDFLPQTSISEEVQMLHVCGGDDSLVAETGEFRSLRTQDSLSRRRF
jgi:hypothetical protein